MRILVVKTGAIGDCINALPFLNRLRAGLPDARVGWLVEPKAAPILEGHPAIDQLFVPVDRRPTTLARVVREMRSEAPDLVIDLQRILRSAVLARAVGGRSTLGFDRSRCKEGSWLLYGDRVAPCDRPGTTVDQYLEFCDHLGLPSAALEWRLPLTDALRESARKLTPDGPFVLLHPGATKPANLWLMDRWRSVAEAAGVDVVVTGAGPADRQVAGIMPGTTDLVDRTSLLELLAVIERSAVVVAPDTGAMHAARALGRPLVALFGAADPDRTGPVGTPEAVIRGQADCVPCQRRHCTQTSHLCMESISADEVLGRIRIALGSEAVS